MGRYDRFTEYIDAVVKAATHVELELHCKSWAEFEWVEDTLIELLERHRDACKPWLDAAAHEETK